MKALRAQKPRNVKVEVKLEPSGAVRCCGHRKVRCCGHRKLRHCQ